LEQSELIGKLFGEIGKLAVSIATLTAEIRATDSKYNGLKETVDSHGVSIKALELVATATAAAATAKNNESSSWKNGILEALKIVVPVLLTILAMRLA